MSLSGPDALRALDEALRDIRREEDEIAKRASRGAELLLKLRAQEAELYRQLGAGRLDEKARAAQAVLIGEINEAVEAAISRFDAAYADAEAALQHIEADLARGNGERAALQSEAGKRDAELVALAARARPQLGSDADYAARIEAARRRQAIAEAATAKAAQAEADREQKGRPFRDDERFMYLWKAGYGTPAYTRKGLVAWLDGWIARLIGYERARTSFALISELPAHLRSHADAMQAAAAAAASEVAEFENVALDTAGGKAAREVLQELAPRIDALDRENVALQDRRDEAIRIRSALVLGTDPAFALAFDEIAQMLDEDELAQLLRDARGAPQGADADLVQQIDDMAQRIKDEADETREQGARLETLAARRRDLEDIQYEIKARGFDNPHARVADDALVGDTLNELLRGEITAAAYWERWRKAQSWTASGYGGPGGGWGRLSAPPLSSSRFSRPGRNASQPKPRSLTSAA